MQLRYLQTLTEICAGQNSTIIFPMPIDIIKPSMERIDKAGKTPIANGLLQGRAGQGRAAGTLMRIMPHSIQFPIRECQSMKRYLLVTTATAGCCLGMVAPRCAVAAPANDPAAAVTVASVANPAATCAADVRGFNTQMDQDGYWMGGSDYGYGYPISGFGYGDGYYGMGFGAGVNSARPLQDTTDYRNARPGYEIRILLASANILAANGQQQGCEDILDTSRALYKLYVADMQNRGVRPAGQPGWQQKEITTARPVTAQHTAFRSDELLDTAVRNTHDEGLGSVDDLVTDPKTGKIDYLVVATGGIFGFDKTYVPIPWADFKVTEGFKLLVLDTTKATMEAAPRVSHNEPLTPRQFEQESQKVDAYWSAHVPVKDVN